MILLKDSAPEELLGGIFEMQSGRNSQQKGLPVFGAFFLPQLI